MTPERAKWWDSLPAEEKDIRRRISFIKSNMQSAKQEAKRLKKLISPGLIYNSITAENISRLHGQINKINGCNFVIKALRKQIAMRPTEIKEDGEYYRECPRCRRYLWRISDDIYFDDPPKYCDDCGQKLRWS